MKLLVTGSSGLVGSACVEFFTGKGWEVIGIDNNTRADLFGTPRKEVSKKLDIRDEGAVNELFAKNYFDAIIHAAAQPSHDWSQKEPLIDFGINATGTLTLLEATRHYLPDATFVYVSTDKVYGENMSVERLNAWPVKLSVQLTTKQTRHEIERTTTEPFRGFEEDLGLDFAGNRSPFGCSKAAADMYVQEYGNYFGMKTACFRCGCITGKAHEGAELHGFLAYLAKCIKEGKTYKIFGHEGKQVRDQIHALDLAAAFWHFIETPKKAAVYNMGGGPERSVSVLEAGEMISQITSKPFLYEFHEGRKGDRVWDVHNVLKFRTDYPAWDYQYSLDDIINDVCAK